MEGHLEVQAPFDLHFGHDVFTDDGRKELDRLMGDEALYCEHWAPECKLFSRARGKPIQLADGRTVQGPQPVRDQKHLMGFPWLSSEAKARVRRSNNMVLKAMRRGRQPRPSKRPCYIGRWNTLTGHGCGSSRSSRSWRKPMDSSTQ